MSTYEKNWEGDFRTNQNSFSPMHGTENSQSNNNEYVPNDLGDVTWQTECKVGFSGVGTRDNSSGFAFNLYNGPEKDPLYRSIILTDQTAQGGPVPNPQIFS